VARQCGNRQNRYRQRPDPRPDLEVAGAAAPAPPSNAPDGHQNRGPVGSIRAAPSGLIGLRLLRVPDQPVRTDMALVLTLGTNCGCYSPDASPVTNLFLRAVMGARAEATFDHNPVTLKPLTPPSRVCGAGSCCTATSPDDRRVSQLEFPEFGCEIPSRVERREQSRGHDNATPIDIMSLALLGEPGALGAGPGRRRRGRLALRKYQHRA
jgi:hypothetical protein